MSLRLAGMLLLQQQAQISTGKRLVLERCMALDIVGTRRPGEVVDIVLVVMMGGRAVRLVPTIALDPRRADDPAPRQREPHVVGAKVGEEFRREMKLMAVPAGVLEHADLRKPLRDEEKVSDCAGPRERSRYVRRPCDLDVHCFTRTHCASQRNLRNGAIRGISVIWRDESKLVGQVTAGAVGADDPKVRDVDPAPVGLLVLLFG